MPSRPNKLSRFWQELKRRKVIKAIAMYAGGAFKPARLDTQAGYYNRPAWIPDQGQFR